MKILCFEVNYIGFDRTNKAEYKVIKDLIESGIIRAIKRYKILNNCSLKEAKKYVDMVKSKYFPCFTYDDDKPYSYYLDKKYHKRVKKYIKGENK